jgi:hypothetical protein
LKLTKQRYVVMLPRLVMTGLARCRPSAAAASAARVVSCSNVVNVNLSPPERLYAIRVKEILNEQPGGELLKRPRESFLEEPSESSSLNEEPPDGVRASEQPSLQTAQAVLDSADPASVDSCAAALVRLGELPDGREVVSSAKFSRISDKIDELCNKLGAAQLQRCVAATVALGIPADARIVACLENELLWNLRKCRFRFLVQVAPFYATLQRTDLERRLYSEVSASLQRR